MSRRNQMKARAAAGAANSIGLEERLRSASEAARGSHPLADASPIAPPGVSSPAWSPEGEQAKSAAPALQQVHDQEIPVDQPAPAEAAAASSGEAYFVKARLSEVDENPFNARKVYRAERIVEMAASLAKNGQDTPGKATIRNGRYVLAAGHYRRFGLLHIHTSSMDTATMDLMVKPNMSDRELYEASYRENAERDDQTAYDNALAWQQLLDDKVYESETELSKALGLSLPNVNKTLAMQRLSPEMRSLVAAAPAAFALSSLYELVLLEEAAGTQKALEVAALVRDGQLGREQVKVVRDQLSAPNSRKPKETSRPYDLLVGGKYQGKLKEFPNGKVTLEVNIGDAATRESFVNEMREKFGVKNPV